MRSTHTQPRFTLSLDTLNHHPQVTREERRLARDKAAYARIKQAFAGTGGAAALAAAAASRRGGSGGWDAAAPTVAGDGGMTSSGRRSNAAGAVAAAARELRPVELVGIYEGQKEAMEQELAAAKVEVGGCWLQAQGAGGPGPLHLSTCRACCLAWPLCHHKRHTPSTLCVGDASCAGARAERAAEGRPESTHQPRPGSSSGSSSGWPTGRRGRSSEPRRPCRHGGGAEAGR